VSGEDPGADDPPDPVALPIEDSLDLHAFAARDVASVVAEYLNEAAAHGFRDVRVIHGRGIGVQREIVRGVLSRHPLVESFAEAPPERGGWGATIVRLRAG
jgi:dsDNA-specific endonuclease/ATPase MutS2